MKHSYMLSDSYCQNWVIQDAIREIIANALSTHDEVELDWREGIGYVHNSERKLETRHLFIGESDNRDDKDAIGIFGEGFKIAGLVFCRNNRRYIARTNEHIFEFGLEYAPDFGCHTLTVEIKPTDNKDLEGTLVEFGCTDDEFYFAKGLFRKLSSVDIYEETSNGTILKSMDGKIYVLGVLIGEQELLFGYDFKDKMLINRDRSIVDMTKVRANIKKILEETTHHDVIKDLIEASIRRDKVAETQLDLYPNWGKPRDAWKQVIDDMGKIAITSGRPEIDAEAEHYGYSIIDAGHLNYAIQSRGEAKLANEVQPKRAKKFVTIDSLERLEKANLSRAVRLYRDVAKGPSCEIKVSDELPEYTLAQHDGNKITIEHRILADFPKTFMVLCREGAHIKSGNGSCSAGFEQALTDIIENIAKTRLLPRKPNKEEIEV